MHGSQESDTAVLYLPIFEFAKIRRGPRVTGHEDYGLYGYSRREELLSCYDGTDGVGAKVVIKVFEGATPLRVRNW
jgi:hypothetical protein